MPQSRATIIGFFAVLLWALLAVLTVNTSPVPPLLLNSIAFSIGGAIGLIWQVKAGYDWSVLKDIKWPVWVLGVGGLFGYHFLYFSALRLAPAAEAGLIAYLWPLLIVLFSGFLPGERLKAGHVIGAIISFIGVGLLVLEKGCGFDERFVLGYALAVLCALIWSVYSVFSRLAGDKPTIVVSGFCLASALLSAIAHLSFETTRWPQDTVGWVSVLLLGLGPVGLAFYLWDVGMKKGNIQLLGVASYSAPLLSTLILIAAGIAAPSASLFLAAALVTGGALLAARAG